VPAVSLDERGRLVLWPGLRVRVRRALRVAGSIL
jgi:hypothetical protein